MESIHWRTSVCRCNGQAVDAGGPKIMQQRLVTTDMSQPDGHSLRHGDCQMREWSSSAYIIRPKIKQSIATRNPPFYKGHQLRLAQLPPFEFIQTADGLFCKWHFETTFFQWNLFRISIYILLRLGRLTKCQQRYDNGLVQEAFIQCWLRSVTQPGHSELTFLVKEATHVKLRTKMLLAASSARGRKWWQQTMTSIPGYTCGNAKVCGTFPCYRKKEALYINMIWKPGILLRLILKPLFLLRHSMPVFKRSGTSRYHLIYGNQILKSSGLNK